MMRQAAVSETLMVPGMRWTLPPLILHPFAHGDDTKELEEVCRASISRDGLPASEIPGGTLEALSLSRRYRELCMLYHIGKDLMRWMGQCKEVIDRDPVLSGAGLGLVSVATLLVENPPARVLQKFRMWGVQNCHQILSRALALQVIFNSLPAFEMLTPHFVRNYHRFADQVFGCWQQVEPFGRIHSINFDFELYSSSEYSRILEAEWGLSDTQATA
jgi:hypothetical protein